MKNIKNIALFQLTYQKTSQKHSPHLIVPTKWIGKITSLLLFFALSTLPLFAELKYFPKDKDELLELVKNEKIKLDEIDTSKITDMSYLFCRADWNECKNSAKNRKNFRGIEKWNVSNVEDMTEIFYGVKSFKQDLSSWGEKNPFAPTSSPKQKESTFFDKAFALIGVDEDKAIQLFLQSLNSKEEKSQDAKLYLAYLYLNNPNGDKKEANRLANEYVAFLSEDCTKDNKSNFCQDYTKPLEFQKVEDIFDVIYFSGGCYAYGMIPSHPSIFNYMGMYYGSNRDNFLGSFCGEVPPPYKIISLSPILKAKNYTKILEFLEAKPYSIQGSMRFGVGVNQRKNELIYSFFPKFDISSSSKWDYSATEDPDYQYFGWIKMVINQYPDLLEAYNKCVKDAQEYYINVLKIEKQTALEYGKRAVELLLLQELQYYTI